MVNLHGVSEWWVCIRLNGDDAWGCIENKLGKMSWKFSFVRGWMVNLREVELWACMRLNGESAWGWTGQLQTGSSVCVSSKMWQLQWLSYLELKECVKRLGIKLSVIRREMVARESSKRKIKMFRVFTALFGWVPCNFEWGTILTIKGNPPYPLKPIKIMFYMSWQGRSTPRNVETRQIWWKSADLHDLFILG